MCDANQAYGTNGKLSERLNEMVRPGGKLRKGEKRLPKRKKPIFFNSPEGGEG